MKTFLFVLVVIIGGSLLPVDSEIYAGFIAGLITGWNAMFVSDLYELLSGKSDTKSQS